VRRKFPEGRKFSERRTGSDLEEHGGCSGSEGTPSTIYCRKSLFLPFEEKMAKKLFYRVCHFDLFKIFNKKWQKKAKPTVNSRGILFFRKEKL
jgi:hypothetical protein